MNAKDIEKLLSVKHQNDVFVPQCKDGATWDTGDLGIIDAWVMKKSWRNPLLIAYEIKISRADFLQDNKWRKYLNSCNEFYFVAPPGIIDKSEISEECGLITTSKNGTRLYTKKKAKYREIKHPADLYKYVVMSRCEIKNDRNFSRMSGKEYWKEWLENKKIDFEFGRRVSKKIRQRVEEECERVYNENRKLQKINSNYEDYRRVMNELGFNPDSYWGIDRNKFRKVLKEIVNGIPVDFETEIKKTSTLLLNLLDSIKKEINNG